MISAPASVLTHGIGGRQDLPISYTLAVWGSGAAVAASVVLLVLAWRKPHFQERKAAWDLPYAISRVLLSQAVRVILGALGVIITIGAIFCGFLGTFQAADNFAPTYLYVLLWLGIVPLSLVFGPIYQWFNPARAIHAALTHLAALDPKKGLRPLPEKLGVWPAFAGIGIYAILELTLFDPSRPLVVASYLTFLLVGSLVGGFLYGEDFFTWGDPFEAYSRVIASVSPFQVTSGIIELRNPLRGLANLARPAGITAFICLLVGSTAFDGMSRTPKFYNWTMFVQGKSWLVHDSFYALCMAGMIAVFGLLFVVGTRAMMKINGSEQAGAVRALAHSILPIALGYVVAHYFSLLVFQIQDVPRLLSDPAGLGWNLLPTSDWRVDYTVLNPGTIALVQVGGIVVGHILGIVAAHDTALATLKPKRVSLSQLPLAIVMVAITTTAVVILLNG